MDLDTGDTNGISIWYLDNICGFLYYIFMNYGVAVQHLQFFNDFK